jgi:hypothetical protein
LFQKVLTFSHDFFSGLFREQEGKLAALRLLESDKSRTETGCRRLNESGRALDGQSREFHPCLPTTLKIVPVQATGGFSDVLQRKDPSGHHRLSSWRFSRPQPDDIKSS